MVSATIVGRRTFGKGLVQVPIQFRDGSMIRLTRARYYTPSGRCVQKPYTPGGEDEYESDLIKRASFAVNVKKMVDLFKEMPAQGITFEVDTQSYEIKVICLNGTFNIVGIDGEQFPRPKPQEENVFAFTIPSAELPKSLDKTVFAAGTDTIRPHFYSDSLQHK